MVRFTLLCLGLWLNVAAVGAAALPLDGATEQEIKAEITNHVGEITRTCYVEFAKRNPKRGGRVSLDFVIYPNGTTGKIMLRTNEFGGKKFFECLTKNVLTWSFPKHQARTEVKDFYFNFQQ